MNPTLQVEHVFAADCDAACRTVLLHNHPDVHSFYDDVCSPAFSNAPPCDVLVAGYPCQPFSSQGLARGATDSRSLVIIPILTYVKKNTPRVVVFENVVGLYYRHTEFFFLVLRTMQAIGYTGSWSRLNSRVHGGVPQSRQRLYHVGVRGAKRVCWPTPIPAASLGDLVDDTPFGSRLPVGRPFCGHRRKVARVLRVLKRQHIDFRSVHIVCVTTTASRGPRRLATCLV